tara:strand:- start:1765 stop:1950 length:186 start_codon:yes stop_codon:yes gene_type:complete
MLGALVGCQETNLFATGHTKGLNLLPKYLLKMRIKKYIYVTVNKLQILLTVMEPIINYNAS